MGVILGSDRVIWSMLPPRRPNVTQALAPDLQSSALEMPNFSAPCSLPQNPFFTPCQPQKFAAGFRPFGIINH
jgi:hypothetical protein